MAEVLKQTLRSLCHRTGWCYAVFWKLKRRSRMVLTWEDGYCEFATVQMTANAALLTGNGRNPFEHGDVIEDQIELAVAKMSFHVYSLGEGIIGRVAFTGKHQWIFGNGETAAGRGQAAPEKYPDGWLNQFAAGIKTIAVVAVPQGVVQLGSVQTMTEDLNLVGQIRALFGTLQSVPGAFVSDFVPDAQGGRNLPPPRASSKTGLTSLGKTYSTPVIGRNLVTTNSISLKGLGGESSDLPSAKGTESGNALYGTHLPSTTWASVPMTLTALDQKSPLELQPSLGMFQNEGTTGSYNSILRSSDAYARDTNRVQADLSFMKRPKLPSDAIGSSIQLPISLDGHSGIASSQNPLVRGQFGGELSSSNFSSEASRVFSGCNGSNAFKLSTDNRQFESSIWSPPGSHFSAMGDFEGLPSFGEETGVINSEEGFDYNSLFKSFQKEDFDDLNGLLASLNKDSVVQQTHPITGSHFAIGDELSEALAPVQKNGPGKDAFLNVLMPSTAEDVKTEKHLQEFELPSEIGLVKIPGYCDILVGLSDNKPEPLLDAVVAGASSLSPCSKPLRESPNLPCFTAPTVCERSMETAPIPTISARKEPQAEKPQAASDSGRGGAMKWSPSSLSMKVAGDSWADGTTKKSDEHVKDTPTARKQDETARVIGRKRLRPGEAPRPRPKDRQQIQDRVRELRDIVPNATKCSIDALLEKTIKHMQFLQSVTQHGDKWKAGGDMKGESIIEQRSSENGASWALEFGGGKNVDCPIVVENLTQPRQMLVEVLCEERGLFWEIADNIRNLGLTILKGVMEFRNDKIWARFNVEQMQASREVNRLKLLWNLMQVLKNSGAATSLTGSEVTDVCSESFTRFQPQVSSHGVTVSPGW